MPNSVDKTYTTSPLSKEKKEMRTDNEQYFFQEDKMEWTIHMKIVAQVVKTLTFIVSNEVVL